jgi:hypothetical protein
MDAMLSGESVLTSEGGTRVRGSSAGSKYGRLIVRTDFTVYFSRTQLVVEMPLHLTGMGVALDEKETGGGTGLGVIQGPIFGALEPSADFKLHHPVQRHREIESKAKKSGSQSESQAESLSESSSFRGEKLGTKDSSTVKKENEGGYTQSQTAGLPENQTDGMPVSMSDNSSSSRLPVASRARRDRRKLGDEETDPMTGVDRGQGMDRGEGRDREEGMDRGQGRDREQGRERGQRRDRDRDRDRERGHGLRKALRNAGVLDFSSDRTDRHSQHNSPPVSDTSYSVRGGERESGDGTERAARRAPRGRQAMEGEYTLIELPVATAGIMHFRYYSLSLIIIVLLIIVRIYYTSYLIYSYSLLLTFFLMISPIFTDCNVGSFYR